MEIKLQLLQIPGMMININPADTITNTSPFSY